MKKNLLLLLSWLFIGINTWLYGNHYVSFVFSYSIYVTSVRDQMLSFWIATGAFFLASVAALMMKYSTLRLLIAQVLFVGLVLVSSELFVSGRDELLSASIKLHSISLLLFIAIGLVIRTQKSRRNDKA